MGNCASAAASAAYGEPNLLAAAAQDGDGDGGITAMHVAASEGKADAILKIGEQVRRRVWTGGVVSGPACTWKISCRGS